MRPVLLVTLFAALSSVGCGEDGVKSRPATWSYIYPTIIRPSCATAGCHSKLSRASGIELDGTHESYVTLVGPGRAGNLVVPGQPEHSKLMFMLTGNETLRMPPDSALPDPDIELIRRWIREGAPE